MSAPAIILMIVAIVVLWGGLVLATRFLVTHPLPPEDGADAEDGHTTPP